MRIEGTESVWIEGGKIRFGTNRITVMLAPGVLRRLGSEGGWTLEAGSLILER
ncbi:MAG: hypothetical protein DIU52_012430 [bacterium]|jgi:hypothetical protein